MLDEVTTDRVLAQWAYSELNSLEQGSKYIDVDELRAKASRNVPFAELSERNCALLLRKWYEVRGFSGSIFTAALDGIEKFRVEHWTKAQLGSAYILPHFFQWLGPQYAFGETTFKDWIEAAPSGELSEHHPLRTTAGEEPSLTDQPPVTVARVHFLIVLGVGKTPPLSGPHRFMLLDGYHRAARFWRRTVGTTSKLAMHVPVTI